MSLSINDWTLVRRVKEEHFAKLVEEGKVAVGQLSFHRFPSISFFVYKSFEIRRQHVVSRDASAINVFRYWNMILVSRRARCVSMSERRKRCFELMRSSLDASIFQEKWSYESSRKPVRVEGNALIFSKKKFSLSRGISLGWKIK